MVDGLAFGTMNAATHLPGAATAIKSARSTPAKLSRARRSHGVCTLAGFGELFGVLQVPKGEAEPSLEVTLAHVVWLGHEDLPLVAPR